MSDENETASIVCCSGAYSASSSMHVRVNVFTYMLCAMYAAVVDMSNHFRPSIKLQQVSECVFRLLVCVCVCVSVLLLFPMYWAAFVLFSNVLGSMRATCIVFSNVLDSVCTAFIVFSYVGASQTQETQQKPIKPIKTMMFKLSRLHGVTHADSFKNHFF